MIRTLPLIILAAGLACAGQISGRLTERGQPVGEGVRVSVTCGGDTRSTATDRFGSYRIYHPRTGECTLVVSLGTRPAPAPVVSYADPVTFDFELIRNSDGSYRLQRR